MTPLFALFILLNVLDVVFTMIGVGRHGIGIEGNPFARAAISTFGLWILIPIKVTAVFWFWAIVRTNTAILVIMNLLLFVVAVLPWALFLCGVIS